MKVIVTDRAIDDLIRIGRFIQQDNPARAATFVAELEQRCATLADLPYAFPLLPGREPSGIRRRHGDYLTFYRLAEPARRTEVLHILHGAQDHDAILFLPG